MSSLRIRSLLAVFFFLVSWTPGSAQFYQFTQSLLTSTPISFNLGNGVVGTITFSGATAGSSGLQTPTTSGTNLVSNFILIQPGSIATFTFNYPISNFDLQYGTGNTTPRVDTFVANTTTNGTFTLPLPTSLAVQNGYSGGGTNIFSLSLSSNASTPLKVGILSSTTPAAPAPLSPVGATLLGNIVAFGMIAFYRRRRAKQNGMAPLYPGNGVMGAA